MKKFLIILGIFLLIIGITGMFLTKDEIVTKKQNGYSEQITLNQPFNSIDLDIGQGTVAVEQSKNHRASLKIKNISKKEDYQYKIDNNTLYFSTKNDSKNRKKNFVFGNHKNLDEIEIKLLIPKEKLKSFKAKTFAGTIDVDYLSTKNLELNADIGLIEGDILKSDQSNIKVGMGDISFNNFNSQQADINIKTGTIELYGLNSDININGHIGMGDGTFEYTTEPQSTHFDISTKNGDIELNDLINLPQSNAKSLVKMTIGTGTVEFDYE